MALGEWWGGGGGKGQHMALRELGGWATYGTRRVGGGGVGRA